MKRRILLAALGVALVFLVLAGVKIVKTPKGWLIKERRPVTRWPNPQSFTLPETLDTISQRVPQ